MSNQKNANERPSLASLQMLRGAAAMMLVVQHLGLPIVRSGGEWSAHWLNAGVDIFFIISGFLMWHTTAGRNISPLDFFRLRIIRIVPLYWTITTLVVLVSIFAPQLMQSAAPEPWRIVGSYLFVPIQNGNGMYVPVLGQGWTLNYEMFFYLVFAISLLFAGRWRFSVSAGVILAFMLLGLVKSGLPRWITTYTNTIMAEFVAGMLIAVWFNSRRSTRSPAPAAMSGAAVFISGWVALIILATYFPKVDRLLNLGVPSLMIFLGAILIEKSGSLPKLVLLRWAGDISYSVYLSHASVLSAAGQVWHKLEAHGLPVSRFVFCVLAFAISMAAGAVVYRWIELPMTRYFRASPGALKAKAA